MQFDNIIGPRQNRAAHHRLVEAKDAYYRAVYGPISDGEWNSPFSGYSLTQAEWNDDVFGCFKKGTNMTIQKCKLCHEKMPNGEGLWVVGSMPDEGPLCRVCYEEEKGK